ncbi:MAG: NAD(P)H-hydrate dehydratase [Deltaproteobacteria bacterium]|nr:NAD(P)H-hydrate dehydratase [Deltaproteobacteria bacterium]
MRRSPLTALPSPSPSPSPSSSSSAPTLISPALLRRWPLPKPDGVNGKDDRGTVLVVGGSQEVPGAVILAGLAALRVGAGKLQIATSRKVASQVAVTVPEARVIGLPAKPSGELQAGAARLLRDDIEQCDALLVGPGMALSAVGAARDVLRARLKTAAGPTVILDAGALGTLAGRDEFARASRPSMIATPHAGEMANLWGISREQVMADPLSLARRAARDLGVVMVLKGARTYVAAPDGRIFYNVAGNSGLGTSGSGDTLSGVIAGLCARGADPIQAAVWGVFLHAHAGDRLATKIGQLGYLARDLLDQLPAVLARLCRPSRMRRSSQSKSGSYTSRRPR